jgi:energy-coupling factor transporter ATP-binding protein EcfA2
MELLEWAKDQPRWQQDALRRLALNGVLTETDVDDLALICLDPKAPSQPLTSFNLAAEDAGDNPVALLRIEKPAGIDAPASNQTLEFAKDGLTVVYGDNASGKSGYVRLLRHVCRTGDREAAILREAEDPVTTPQTAKIVFWRGVTEVEFSWAPGISGHPDLTAVSIFDARSANIHVEKTDAVAFIPRPMKILEALEDACDRVRARLESQISASEAQKPIVLNSPKLGRETTAGALVHNLSANSNLAQLTLLATLSTEDLTRLRMLAADLTQDPKHAALRLVNQKKQLDEQVARLGRLVAATSDRAFVEREKLKADRDTKSEAARLASERLFAASPLPEAGHATWRSLWEAARKYSSEVIERDSTSDAFADSSSGVSFQQLPGTEATRYRMSFESFVKEVTKTEEEKATKAYSRKFAEAAAARIPVDDLLQLRRLIADEIGDPVLARKVKDCCIRAKWRLRAFEREHTAPDTESSFPEADLSTLSASLGERAARLSADRNSPEHLALLKEFLELNDREALQPLLEDIKAEIERQKKIDTINEALKDVAKEAVATKNGDFSDKLVTNALRGRFAREIEKMKLTRMPVELKKIKDQNAVSHFQVCLVEKPNASVGQLFSEGEHRCVALAAFLAELATSKRYSGIVFDDPMASLDPVHRQAVAARLVEEAEHRQVVVFTHDLTFLLQLRREAEASSRTIRYQTVRRKLTHPNNADDKLPDKARSAVQLTQTLRSELNVVKWQFDHWPDAKRNTFCKGFIEQLKETWDRSIADFIFPTQNRFDNHTKGTSQLNLATMEQADVETVMAARGRLSEEPRASAGALNPDTISYGDLFAEIGKLEDWLAHIGQRQKDVKAQTISDPAVRV